MLAQRCKGSESNVSVLGLTGRGEIMSDGAVTVHVDKSTGALAIEGSVVELSVANDAPFAIEICKPIPRTVTELRPVVQAIEDSSDDEAFISIQVEPSAAAPPARRMRASGKVGDVAAQGSFERNIVGDEQQSGLIQLSATQSLCIAQRTWMDQVRWKSLKRQAACVAATSFGAAAKRDDTINA